MSTINGLTADPISQAFFRAYKPFRNGLRRLSLEESLLVIWTYSAHLSRDLTLPPMFRGKGGEPIDIRDYVWPWELALLAREVLLNASANGTASLLNFPALVALSTALITSHRSRPTLPTTSNCCFICIGSPTNNFPSSGACRWLT